MKLNIKELDFEEIQNTIKGFQEPAFRAKQVFEWLWKKNVQSFSEMSNLSKNLREKLDAEYIIEPIKISHKVSSQKDDTSKYIFSTHDDLSVEGVLIPSRDKDRVTACISTQVGCPLKCKFCATGTLGFKRNLTSSEIYEQVFLLNTESEKIFERKLSNIVVMGMGEPLLNYENLMKALDMVCSENGLAMSPSRITVSTVGLTKQIRKLADDKPRFNLAISLHTARNEQRSEIMPVNESNSIKELIEALKYFSSKTGNRITFEYLMIDGITDTKADAKALAMFCKNFPSKINLIQFNKVSHIDYSPSKQKNFKEFFEFIESKNLVVTIRQSKGQDIDAACGQLALKNKKE